MITQERIIIALAFIIAGLICFIISQRPALSKKEEQELKELDDIIARTYGFKK